MTSLLRWLWDHASIPVMFFLLGWVIGQTIQLQHFTPTIEYYADCRERNGFLEGAWQHRPDPYR